MALLSVIRRWHFRQHIPIREIERRTGLSRNTIRKYLRADTVEPEFQAPDRPSNRPTVAMSFEGRVGVDFGPADFGQQSGGEDEGHQNSSFTAACRRSQSKL